MSIFYKILEAKTLIIIVIFNIYHFIMCITN